MGTFLVLCSQYQPSIKRDPCYTQYLDKIGQIFFGIKPRQQQQNQGLFGNLFNSLLGSLDDDSDDENPQPSSSRQVIENNDLD